MAKKASDTVQSNGQTDDVVAVVSPRSRGGVSLFEAAEPITTENVDQFYSDPADIAAARNELRRLGFRVEAESKTTLTIVGSQKLFEDVFGAKLEKQTRAAVETPDAEAGEVTFYTAPAAPEAELLHAPEPLADLIEGVALSEPPIFLESPLPPITQPATSAYRYLFAPDEIAVILNAARIHRNGTTGAGINIAMVDTGFYRHPFYNRHGYRVKSTVLGPGAINPNDDEVGHGTGEAANIFAVAPDAVMTPVKMGDPVGSFKAAVATNPHIITCSWVLLSTDVPACSLTPYGASLAAEIASAVVSGIVVCFAAGNGHRNVPSGHPDIISVGGVHVDYPTLSLEASSYASSFTSCIWHPRAVPDLCGLVGKKVSNRAPSLMLPVRPECDIDTTLATTGLQDGTADNDGWALFSGTSAATPQCAGVAALLLQKDATLTPAQVRDILKKSATDIKAGHSAHGDSAGPGTDAATGAGLLNAKWAWIITMGDLAASFFEAPMEKQAELLANGQMPRFTRGFIADLMDTLRTR